MEVALAESQLRGTGMPGTVCERSRLEPVITPRAFPGRAAWLLMLRSWHAAPHSSMMLLDAAASCWTQMDAYASSSLPLTPPLPPRSFTMTPPCAWQSG
eukprot:1551158-Rhodomonas_salina.4